MPHKDLRRIGEGIPDPSRLSLRLRMLKLELPDPVDSYPDILKQANPLEFYARIQPLDDVLQPCNILTENS